MSYYAPFYRPMGYYTPAVTNTQETGFYGAQNATSDIIWVLNENEADSYPVAPNRSVVLFDKSSPTIYIKTMSSTGVPSKRILDFTERAEAPVKAPNSTETITPDKYVTREDFNALKGDFERLAAKYEQNEPKKKKSHADEEENKA